MRGWGKVKDWEDGNLVVLPLLAVSSFARGVTLSALHADSLGCQSPCPILVSPPHEAAVCPRQTKRMFAPWSFSLDQAAETIHSSDWALTRLLLSSYKLGAAIHLGLPLFKPSSPAFLTII